MSISLNKPIICPILIGRQSEVTTLHALIDQARSAQGQVVLISGEAGIGKSRLVAEAKTYATEQGFLLLQGNCFPTDRSSPYAPLLDLLRSSQARELLTTYTANLEPLARDLALLHQSSAEECVRFERESFGALHQMLAGVSEAERASVWEEIANELRQFETADGFVGPCEMLVAVGAK